MSDLLEAIDYVIGKDDYNTYRPIEVLSDGINFIDNVETQEIGFLPNSDILSIILKPDGLIIIQSLQSEVERLSGVNRQQLFWFLKRLNDMKSSGINAGLMIDQTIHDIKQLLNQEK